MLNFNQFYQRTGKSQSATNRPNSAFMSVVTPKYSHQYSRSLFRLQNSENSDQKYGKKHQNLKSSTRTYKYSLKAQKKSITSSQTKENYRYQVLNLNCIKRLQIQNPCVTLNKLKQANQMRPYDIRKKKEDRARQKQFLGKKFKCLINRSNRVNTEPLEQNNCSFAVEGFKII